MATSWNQMDLRKANNFDIFDKDIGETIRGLKNANYDPWIWEFILADVEVIDGAAHEVRVDFTAEFNGEATPIVLYVIGAAANEDKAAGTGARGVTIYGIDADGNPNSEEVLMHATNATEVATVLLWKRFCGAQVTTVGTGGVNAGIIQISNIGQAAVYGTIDTGEMSTIGARVYVPTNYKAFLTMRGGIVAANDATAVLEAYDGVIVKPVYSTSPHMLAVGSHYIPVGSVGMIDLGIPIQIVTGGNTRYISFTQTTKSNDSNQTVVYHIKTIMYGTTNTLRGLGA